MTKRSQNSTGQQANGPKSKSVRTSERISSRNKCNVRSKQKEIEEEKNEIKEKKEVEKKEEMKVVSPSKMQVSKRNAYTSLLSKKFVPIKPRKFEVALQNDSVRPVMYRYKSLNTIRRPRVTKHILNQLIPKFHLEDFASTSFKEVQYQSLAETMYQYLEASKPFMLKSEFYFDEMVATVLEYDNSTKVLHFGKSLIKHSCKQKKLKFIDRWYLENSNFGLRKQPSGFFPDSEKPVYEIHQDPVLYKNHFLARVVGESELVKAAPMLIDRLKKRRQTDDVIVDSTYFVREFFLAKTEISLRATRSSDIPDRPVPPTLDCGYFPRSALTELDQKRYLAARYSEAQVEYLNLNYESIQPAEGFVIGSISTEELHEFHLKGRHIHGFFIVWESTEHFHRDEIGDLHRKRYLVDMFFKQKFPIDVKFEQWETRLKLAFDRVTLFLLNLTEILRINRPIFDKLAQNPSLFQQLSFPEMTDLLEEQDEEPKKMMARLDGHFFYTTSQYLCNKSYLSAFFIICGGTKILKPIGDYEMECFQRMTERQFNPKHFSINNREETSDEAMNTTQILIEKVPKKPEIKKKNEPIFDESRVYRRKFENVQKSTKPFPKRKLKPGRKPKTLVDISNSRHNFQDSDPSDIESEYEGFVSEIEDFDEDFEFPTLKRSQSSDSIFLDYDYKQKGFRLLTSIHKQRFHSSKMSTSERKKRMVKRIVQKHQLNYKLLINNNATYDEYLNYYHRNLPGLAKEVAKMKKLIRLSKPEPCCPNCPCPNCEKWRNWGPKVVDDLAHLLHGAVAQVAMEEFTMICAKNEITKLVHETRKNRLSIVERYPVKDLNFIHGPMFRSIEAISLHRISDRTHLNATKKQLLHEMRDMLLNYETMSLQEKRLHQNRKRIQREDSEFEEYWRKEIQREKWLDKTLKIVKLEKRSIVMQHFKDDLRQLERTALNERAHAKKTGRQYAEKSKLDEEIENGKKRLIMLSKLQDAYKLKEMEMMEKLKEREMKERHFYNLRRANAILQFQ